MERFNRLGLGTQVESPREVHQQVFDGVNPKLRELLGAFWPDLLDELHRRVEFELGHGRPDALLRWKHDSLSGLELCGVQIAV